MSLVEITLVGTSKDKYVELFLGLSLDLGFCFIHAFIVVLKELLSRCWTGLVCWFRVVSVEGEII